ncbi:MAG: hypothetical protein HY974_00770 [Candidatus Kerfeldbacteria bacterium]|nr:hypothetical protein [Candidatus Kerfeldbacteria bacterium]
MTYQQDDSQGGSRGGYSGGFRGGFHNRPPRQMVDVSAMNIKCADCGAAITELPFQPDPNRLNTLRCRDCLRKSRPPRY